MKKVSVTTLEKFRRYLADASPYDTKESVIDSIKGLFTGNDKTRIGSAYHKIIEGRYESMPNGSILTKADGLTFWFTEDQAAPALFYKSQHNKVVYEMPVSKVYEVPGFLPIQVVGRIDGMEGIKVRDTKTRFRHVDQSDYTESVQWKFYLDMVGERQFFYDVFEFKNFTSIQYNRQGIAALNSDVQIIAHPELSCMWDDNCYDEMIELLQMFNGFLETYGLNGFLKNADN